jgi:serine phosphatase RsbU (regulator of sigma subunit)
MSPDSGGHTLVLVEDDAGDRLLVTEMLFDVAPELRLMCFSSIHAALAQWPAAVDCVLLDLGLPDAMGLTALERLRARDPDVPVVVLTGRIDDGIGPEALAAGAQDFLVKGQVDGHGLERSIRYAVERGRAALDRRNFLAAELRAQENVRLQRGLLPSPLLESQAISVTPFYRPGSDRALLGGDFYDVVETPSGIHMLIGDVCGHGPDEAALGVALRIAWRTLVLAGHVGADVVRGVEQVLLAEGHDDGRFATIATVSLDPTLARADVILCGHPAPLLVTGNEVRALSDRHLPMLTMLGRRNVEPLRVDLPDEWGLLMFTDGLIEGHAETQRRERYGAGRVAQHLTSLLSSGIASEAIAGELVSEAERCNGGPLTDDVAVLLAGSAGWWH